MNANRRSAGSIITLIAVVAAMALAPAPGVFADDAKTEPAMEGYCPASYQLGGKAVKGDPAFKSTHQGLTYHLAGAEAKKAFDADPAKYLPQYGELCTTALGGTYGNRMPAVPTVFDVRDGKLYIFSSERAKRAYETDPPSYIAKANRLFREPAVGGHCPVSYVRDNKAVKGDAKHALWYANYVYHFADAEAKAMFQKDPPKYLPQFTMTFPKRQEMCALGVSREKLFPALPTAFAVIDGKLYFFWDDDAKQQFMQNPAAFLANAHANWPALNKKK